MAVRESIRSLLERWLPGRELDIERATSGGSTEVYRVRAGAETYWLRLAEDPGEDRSVEYVVHDRLRWLGARVPEILLFEVAPPELDRSAALTSHISGIPLSECRDPDIARRVAYSAGQDLSRINDIQVTGYGWIDRIESGEIVAEHSTRPAWANEYVHAVEKLTTRNVFPIDATGVLLRAVADWRQIDFGPGQSRLAHGDFDSSHIFWDPGTGEYTGIIDFGEARGTDIEYDLGHLLLHDGEGQRPEISEAVAFAWSADWIEWRLSRRMNQQAIAIGTRRLAIMLDRGQSAYSDWLRQRLIELLRLWQSGASFH